MNNNARWMETLSIVVVLLGFFVLGSGTGFFSRLAAAISPTARVPHPEINITVVGAGIAFTAIGSVLWLRTLHKKRKEN